MGGRSGIPNGMPQGTPTGIPAGTAGRSAGGILVPPDPAAFRRRQPAPPQPGGRFLGTPMGVLCEPSLGGFRRLPGFPPADRPTGMVPPIGGTVWCWLRPARHDSPANMNRQLADGSGQAAWHGGRTVMCHGAWIASGRPAAANRLIANHVPELLQVFFQVSNLLMFVEI